MSRDRLSRKPMIALVHNADRAFMAHMVRNAHLRGRPDIKPSHNALFGLLGDDGDRAANLAARAGMTRQSMGEVIRELVELGVLEMVPDPDDGRAKLVRYTSEGKAFASAGYRHLQALEDRFAAEFGDGYETARAVLIRMVELLEDQRRGGGPTLDAEG